MCQCSYCAFIISGRFWYCNMLKTNDWTKKCRKVWRGNLLVACQGWLCGWLLKHSIYISPEQLYWLDHFLLVLAIALGIAFVILDSHLLEVWYVVEVWQRKHPLTQLFPMVLTRHIFASSFCHLLPLCRKDCICMVVLEQERLYWWTCFFTVVN